MLQLPLRIVRFRSHTTMNWSTVVYTIWTAHRLMINHSLVSMLMLLVLPVTLLVSSNQSLSVKVCTLAIALLRAVFGPRTGYSVKSWMGPHANFLDHIYEGQALRDGGLKPLIPWTNASLVQITWRHHRQKRRCNLGNVSWSAWDGTGLQRIM